METLYGVTHVRKGVLNTVRAHKDVDAAAKDFDTLAHEVSGDNMFKMFANVKGLKPGAHAITAAGDDWVYCHCLEVAGG